MSRDSKLKIPDSKEIAQMREQKQQQRHFAAIEKYPDFYAQLLSGWSGQYQLQQDCKHLAPPLNAGAKVDYKSGQQNKTAKISTHLDNLSVYVIHPLENLALPKFVPSDNWTKASIDEKAIQLKTYLQKNHQIQPLLNQKEVIHAAQAIALAKIIENLIFAAHINLLEVGQHPETSSKSFINFYNRLITLLENQSDCKSPDQPELNVKHFFLLLKCAAQIENIRATSQLPPKSEYDQFIADLQLHLQLTHQFPQNEDPKKQRLKLLIFLNKHPRIAHEHIAIFLEQHPQVKLHLQSHARILNDARDEKRSKIPSQRTVIINKLLDLLESNKSLLNYAKNKPENFLEWFDYNFNEKALPYLDIIRQLFEAAKYLNSDMSSWINSLVKKLQKLSPFNDNEADLENIFNQLQEAFSKINNKLQFAPISLNIINLWSNKEDPDLKRRRLLIYAKKNPEQVLAWFDNAFPVGATLQHRALILKMLTLAQKIPDTEWDNDYSLTLWADLFIEDFANKDQNLIDQLDKELRQVGQKLQDHLNIENTLLLTANPSQVEVFTASKEDAAWWESHKDTPYLREEKAAEVAALNKKVADGQAALQAQIEKALQELLFEIAQCMIPFMQTQLTLFKYHEKMRTSLEQVTTWIGAALQPEHSNFSMYECCLHIVRLGSRLTNCEPLVDAITSFKKKLPGYGEASRLAMGKNFENVAVEDYHLRNTRIYNAMQTHKRVVPQRQQDPLVECLAKAKTSLQTKIPERLGNWVDRILNWLCYFLAIGYSNKAVKHEAQENGAAAAPASPPLAAGG